MAERIPEQLIQEIIAANDIVDFIGKYVTLKRSGSSLVGLCPFHKEKTPSFHVTPDRQVYHCFGCNAGGNVVEFVKNIENLDFIEAIKFLAERANINLSNNGFSREDSELYKRKQDILKINVESARFFRDKLFSKEGEKALLYAAKRKLGNETIKTYGLGFAPDNWDSLTRHLMHMGYTGEQLVDAGVAVYTKTGKMIDKFRNRLMFPIIDIRGNVIGFGGRIMDEGNVKYLNSPDTPVFNKGRNLFSLNFAKSADDIILVEGYMDVISLYQSGIKNAVASLGTALTQEQARLLSRCCQKVTICYDSDEAGIKATERAIDVFSGLPVKLHILTLHDVKDPDDFIKKYGAAKFAGLKEKAQSVIGYRLSRIKSNYNISDTDGKIDYLKECAKVLAKLESSVERDVLITNISEETNTAASAIAAEVLKYLKKTEKSEKWAVKPKPMMQKPQRQQRGSAAMQLISLCVADANVIKKFGNEITEDLFTNEVHQKIVGYLKEKTEPAVIISKFRDDQAAEAAAALGMPLNFENKDSAARDLIKSLKREKYDYLVRRAIEENDVETLNSLVMKNGGISEGGNI